MIKFEKSMEDIKKEAIEKNFVAGAMDRVDPFDIFEHLWSEDGAIREDG